jgi:hypothetical protein
MHIVTERINNYNEYLKQWIPMPNFVKNRLIFGKKLITYCNQYRKDQVEDNLCTDDQRFL